MIGLETQLFLKFLGRMSLSCHLSKNILSRPFTFKQFATHFTLFELNFTLSIDLGLIQVAFNLTAYVVYKRILLL